jgi:hypothetical protein
LVVNTGRKKGGQTRRGDCKRYGTVAHLNPWHAAAPRGHPARVQVALLDDGLEVGASLGRVVVHVQHAQVG